ncbi:MAG: family 10 glycosylhydrolase [Tannerellaceae bacterium]|nr:family 10 glycosylhydrolase [Tannerellaceae bacterium]
MVRVFLLLLFSSLSLYAVEPPKTEIRAVWLTTVYGLDWPKKAATTAHDTESQKEELLHILDRLEEANFNTVFIQARLRGDLIYRSTIEPFSRVFTGKHNQKPGYDPLQFVIDECHKRRMECHAWFVTFPLGSEQGVRLQGNSSTVKRQPKLVKKHKGEWYLDPGVPETSDYILSLVRELVSSYDVDGIHFDYIRYPEQPQSFPDKSLYSKYGKGVSLADWRRDNINRLMACIYDEVKKMKPWVQVSSSPLGKYNRTERAPNTGWTAYESVFQDPGQWMKEGKQDMIVPMMYYRHDDFFPFVDNWARNSNGRLIVPGLGAYRTDEKEGGWTINDITDQIDYSRYFGGAGCAFFRCEHILENRELYNELKDNYYAHPAQLPPLPWLNKRLPEAPEEVKVERSGDCLRLYWDKPAGEEEALTYTLYYSLTDSIGHSSAKSILATGLRSTEFYLPVKEKEQGYLFGITSSTRYHIESLPSRETYYYLIEHPK